MDNNLEYGQAKEQYEFLKRRLQIYDNLIDAKVPKRIVHDYLTPTLSSGYVYGEEIIVVVNDTIIESTYNDNYIYRKDKKRYGRMYYRFNIKQMKEYIEYCRKKNDSSLTFSERLTYQGLKRQMERKCLVPYMSRYKEEEE